MKTDCIAGLIDSSLQVFREKIDEKYEQDVIDVVLECFKFCLIKVTCPTMDRMWPCFVTNLVPLKNTNVGLIEKLTKSCSAVVQNLLFSSEPRMDSILNLHHIVGQCFKYLTALEMSENFDDTGKYVCMFIEGSLSRYEFQKRVDGILKLMYSAEVINGKLSLIIGEEKEHTLEYNFSDIFSSDLMKQFVTSSLFSVLLLFKIFGLDESCYNVEHYYSDKGDFIDFTDDNGILDEAGLKNVELTSYTTNLADSILYVTAFRIFKKNFWKVSTDGNF